MQNNYFGFDLFIFDLDGTLIDSEIIHCNAYNKAIKLLGFDLKLNIEEYLQLTEINDSHFKLHLINCLQITNEKYDELYNLKTIFVTNDICHVKMIEGAEELLNNLKKSIVPFCLATHSKSEIVNIILRKFPILQSADIILTRELYTKKKPDPECYLQILSKYPLAKHPIGFEDSYKGYCALSLSVKYPVLISSRNINIISFLQIKSYSDINNVLQKIEKFSS